ncbi:hypothetical protein [Pseudonocardia humida]|uniref:MFS transporter n=1 Tax=Pseudonocardia humida TaxID=2800819 RepID=A0ABT1AAA5_9PSEU|nr:hypothetical protein [Pseudonocardia humida]MCO1659868.1 hypothetical protein [Pseudonocardia humida]
MGAREPGPHRRVRGAPVPRSAGGDAASGQDPPPARGTRLSASVVDVFVYVVVLNLFVEYLPQVLSET